MSSLHNMRYKFEEWKGKGREGREKEREGEIENVNHGVQGKRVR